MKRSLLSSALVAILLGMGVASVEANPVPINLVIENGSSENVDDVNFNVLLTAVGGSQVDFKFTNDTPGSGGIITFIAFEDGLFTAIANGSIQSESAGVDFNKDGSAGNLPGGNAVGFTEQDTYSRANQGGVSNGINSGGVEFLTIRYDLIGGNDINDLLALIGGSPNRIGLHVQSFGDGGSITTITQGGTVIPLPAAAWAGISLMGTLGGIQLIRRRLSH